MTWDVAHWENILRTTYVKGNGTGLEKRTHLINEALGWGGSSSHPQQHQVGRSANGGVLIFEKPGKEAAEGTNMNDMKPIIIINGTPLNPPSFSFIWSDLTNIATTDFEAFRAVLVLIYRSAFLLDHKTNSEGKLRYEPEPEIKACVAELDKQVGSLTEFGSVDGLLRFIDLLGWNEDVKYHSFEGRASFTEGKYGGKDKRIGRVRTFLTCIRVPYDISQFMIAHKREIEGFVCQGAKMTCSGISIHIYPRSQGFPSILSNELFHN
jgi:hypothetical protein